MKESKENKPLQSVGTITYRTFLVFILGIAMGVGNGFYMGILHAERDQNHIAVMTQKKVMYEQGKILGNLPRDHDAIKWVRNKAR